MQGMIMSRFEDFTGCCTTVKFSIYGCMGNGQPQTLSQPMSGDIFKSIVQRELLLIRIPMAHCC